MSPTKHLVPSPSADLRARIDALAQRLVDRRRFNRAEHETFGIVLTRTCSVGCAHCINDSKPGRTGALTPSDVRTALDQLVRHDEITTVNYTGGEPFEVYDLLREAVRETQERRLRPTVVTSAVWAEDPVTAHRRLTPLVTAGLSALIVSRDAFHEHRVPPEYAVAAIRSARSHGLTVALNLTTGAPYKGRDELLAPLQALMSSAELAAVQVNEAPLLRAGRAAFLHKLRAPADPPPPDPAEALVCSVNGPVLTDAGRYTACCGPELPDASPLVLGHLHATPLEVVLERSEDDEIVSMIRSLGLRRMIDLLEEAGQADEEVLRLRGAGKRDICLVCMYLLESPARVATLRRIARTPAVRRQMHLLDALILGAPTGRTCDG
jgi:hypothetical protein